MPILKGMTWDHPRGYQPMVATAAVFSQQHPEVTIHWDKRSLQDFEHFPVEVLAAEYDLIVLDHPHIGQLAEAGVLLPFADADLSDLSGASVGPSFESYRWQGRIWALPIDAAAQVQAWRPDLVGAPPSDWANAISLAAAGRVVLPLRSPHELMSFFTLAANAGTPCHTAGDILLPVADTVPVLERLRDLARLVAPDCRSLDPIGALEQMATTDRYAVSPLIYGYAPYAEAGFRLHRLRFVDIPAMRCLGPIGSALGGTGLGVSVRCQVPDLARAYALFTASGPVQRGLYAENEGQPAHRSAWLDEAVNARANDFYAGTLATLDGAWLRPRHDGYVGFQKEASQLVSAHLDGAESLAIAHALNESFRLSQAL